MFPPGGTGSGTRAVERSSKRTTKDAGFPFCSVTGEPAAMSDVSWLIGSGSQSSSYWKVVNSNYKGQLSYFGGAVN